MLYKNTEPEIMKVKPFIISKLFGIFYFLKMTYLLLVMM